MRLNRGVGLVICLLLAVGSSLAQSPNGMISGIVTDPSERAIAGAEVVAVNEATGVQYASKTNEEGIYVFSNLPPGPYRLQVSRIGFKTPIKPGVILNVQDALAINFALPLGAVAETVTIEGGAPLIDTQDAAVSTVVDRQFAENLPLNGRSFQSLIYLTPGVVATTSSSSDSGQFSVNGQRASSNYWMVDGVSANVGVGASGITPGNGFGGTVSTLSALGGTNSLVSVDAMQEFRIQTSTFAPEFGRTPGGQISIVTRSGTNRLHGTAFDYVRNDLFDASNWFANSAGVPKPRERQNDFGGTLNGPIRKDRTFFFFSYEGLRLRLPQTAISTVPDGSGTAGGLNARENAVPATQPFLNAFPLPNGPEVFAPCDPGTDPACLPTGQKATGQAQFNASYSNPATLDAYSLRLDHKWSGRFAIFGRYNDSPSEITARGGAGGFESLSTLQSLRIRTQTGTAGLTWSISPMMVNDLRFNYSSTSAQSHEYLDAFQGAIPLPSLPLPAGFTSQNSFFEFNILGLGNYSGLAVGEIAQSSQHQINVVDSLFWQKGPHSLKFGVDVRRLAPASLPQDYQQTALLSDVPASETGSDATGIVQSSQKVNFLFLNLGAYAQDSWRVLPRLTLTYGLRWDVDFAPSSLDGPAIPAVTGYSLTDLSRLAFASPGTPAFNTAYGNVAPRLGLAYELTQDQGRQTVLRGGFGVFYDLVSAETGNAVSLTVPPFGNFNFFQATFPFTSAQVAPVQIPSIPTLSGGFEVFNPNLKLPYTLEWNVALERSLGNDQTVTASYIGASGRRLLQSNLFLAPPTNPNIGEGVFVDNTASSSYQAFQLQFQRRLSHGLQALASYTWSHSIDDGSTSSSASLSSAGVPGSPNENRGSSDFDIRHAFSAGLSYNIPSLRRTAFGQAMLGGWSTENFILARTAPPVDISDKNFVEFNSGIFTNIRPDVAAGQAPYLYGPQYPGGKAINPAAFENPPTDPNTGNPVRQGNLGRNTLRGFGATEWDFALHRDFPIRESLKIQFRAEMFNVLNHPNFGPPSKGFGSVGFGVSSQTLAQSLSGGRSLGAGGFNPLYQIGGPRSTQLALKLFF